MQYLKFTGLAAIAAAALMAFAGSASATTLTGAGGATLGTGTAIAAENERTLTLDAAIGTITCTESHMAAKTTNGGGAGVNVTANVESLSFSGCNATVTVLVNGTLSIEGIGSNNGILNGTGNEVTVELEVKPNRFHCIFKTNATNLGTVTGSSTTKSTATLDISATIPRTGGSSGAFCGTTAQWTGSYAITSPDTLNIDK